MLSSTSPLITLQDPCLGNGATRAGLGFLTSITLIMTVPHSHSHKSPLCRQPLLEILLPGDSKLNQDDREAHHRTPDQVLLIRKCSIFIHDAPMWKAQNSVRNYRVKNYRVNSLKKKTSLMCYYYLNQCTMNLTFYKSHPKAINHISKIRSSVHWVIFLPVAY